MKSISLLWTGPNTGATNSSGFAGLPGGSRNSNGAFNYIGVDGNWWSSTENSATVAWSRLLNFNNTIADRFYYNKTYGFYVRCVRD